MTKTRSLITLSSNISQFYNYQQIPYFVSASTQYSSSLYTTYGDISYPFNPQFGDKILLSDYRGVIQNLDIISSDLSSTGNVEIIVTPQVLGNWELVPSEIYQVLILKRYRDEQNIIISYTKPPGQTSYGFLIPNTISPTVIDNINTLQAAVQTQLLSNPTQPSTDVLNGGTF